MDSQEFDYLNGKKDYLNKWLSRFQDAKDIVPEVQKNLEITNWGLETIRNRPHQSDEIPIIDLENNLKRDYDYTRSAFPMLPEINPVMPGTATSMATSITFAVYDNVVKYGNLGTPDAINYSNTYTKRYHEIQLAQQRPQQVQNLLKQHCGQNTVNRFIAAEDSYWQAKSGTTNGRESALEMRNTLEGLKGDLWQLAKRTKNENMTWERMSERLAKNEGHGIECDELINQGTVRLSLIDRLSDIQKDRVPLKTADLDHLWTQFLDHIFTVLGLIK